MPGFSLYSGSFLKKKTRPKTSPNLFKSRSIWVYKSNTGVISVDCSSINARNLNKFQKNNLNSQTDGFFAQVLLKIKQLVCRLIQVTMTDWQISNKITILLLKHQISIVHELKYQLKLWNLQIFTILWEYLLTRSNNTNASMCIIFIYISTITISMITNWTSKCAR